MICLKVLWFFGPHDVFSGFVPLFMVRRGHSLLDFVTNSLCFTFSGQPAAPLWAASHAHLYLTGLHGCLCSALKLARGWALETRRRTREGRGQPMKGSQGRLPKWVASRLGWGDTRQTPNCPQDFHWDKQSPIVTLDSQRKQKVNKSPSCKTILLNKLLSKQCGRFLPTIHWETWREIAGSRFFFF